MYSDFSNTIDGAGHTRRDDLKSSREAADTTLDGNLFHSLAVIPTTGLTLAQNLL